MLSLANIIEFWIQRGSLQDHREMNFVGRAKLARLLLLKEN